jgi:hypothetical protein
MNLEDLVIGRTYTRRQIHQAVGGGDLQSYLPQKNGRILAGCFIPKLNQRAPQEVDAGDAPDVIRKAKAVAADRSTIPVFLKRRTDQWEYRGIYKCLRFSQEPRDIRAHQDRRKDAAAVLYFEAVQDDTQPTPDIELIETRASEGRSIYLLHLVKERKRGLVLAKRSEL